MHAKAFVVSYFEAWNNQDAQAVADHLAENGRYLDIPIHQHMSRPELIEHLEASFEVETNRYELVGEVLSSSNSIAFQYRVTPRSLNGAADDSQAWYGAEFITLRDGAAVEIADYYEHQDSQLAHDSPLASATRNTLVQRYAKSGLDAGQMDDLKQRLNGLMEQDRAYLRANITLPDLAGELGCTVNHLSQVINAGFGVSFFDYLNEYRVKEAMALLEEDNGEPRTVLGVALDVGFNSTSTFYVAFKKVTGKTPAQYRRAQAN